MRKFLVLITFILPALFLQAQNTKQLSSNLKKDHIKVISPSRLPKSITNYISANLPNATITKAMKQRRTPGAAFIVKVDIKAKHHTLIFNKDKELVNLDGKKLETTTLKKR